jgi:predicted transcriptional regulator of viral defense system
MRTPEALASLLAMGQSFVTTRDAAVRLNMPKDATSHLMRRLANDGLVTPIRRGLWSLDLHPDPLQLAGWVTKPYPSYVSLWSALFAHGVLSQVPRETYVVSLGRPRRVATHLGSIVVHQIAPEVFGGFATERGVALASPTKAVFDLAYLSATHGVRFRQLPELDLSRAYRVQEARRWVGRIRSQRIRSLVKQRLATIERAADLRSEGPSAS